MGTTRGVAVTVDRAGPAAATVPRTKQSSEKIARGLSTNAATHTTRAKRARGIDAKLTRSMKSGQSKRTLVVRSRSLVMGLAISARVRALEIAATALLRKKRANPEGRGVANLKEG